MRSVMSSTVIFVSCEIRQYQRIVLPADELLERMTIGQRVDVDHREHDGAVRGRVEQHLGRMTFELRDALGDEVAEVRRAEDVEAIAVERVEVIAVRLHEVGFVDALDSGCSCRSSRRPPAARHHCVGLAPPAPRSVAGPSPRRAVAGVVDVGPHLVGDAGCLRSDSRSLQLLYWWSSVECATGRGPSVHPNPCRMRERRDATGEATHGA